MGGAGGRDEEARLLQTRTAADRSATLRARCLVCLTLRSSGSESAKAGRNRHNRGSSADG